MQGAGGGVSDGVDADADLAVADLAQDAGVLPGHPGEAIPSPRDQGLHPRWQLAVEMLEWQLAVEMLDELAA